MKNGKHCWGRPRKCWIPAFSPNPTMFSKRLFLGLQNSGLCGNELNPRVLYRVTQWAIKEHGRSECTKSTVLYRESLRIPTTSGLSDTQSS